MKILTVQMTNVLQLAVKVSEETKTDVFLNYYPHVSKYEIDIHSDGWNANHEADKKWHIWLSNKDAYKQLSEVYAYLKDILDKQKESRSQADQSKESDNKGYTFI